MEKKTAPNKKADAFETFEEAGDIQRKAAVACVEAAAEVGAQFDRLVRAQVGHQTAAVRTATEFMTQSMETALKTQETVRQAGVAPAALRYESARVDVPRTGPPANKVMGGGKDQWFLGRR